MAITLLCPTRSKRERIKCIRMAAAVLILFAGLRSWWYGDLTKYYRGYLNAWHMSVSEIYEAQGLRNIGISLCFKVMSTLFGQHGYDYFIFIVSCFSVGTLSKVIARYSPSPYFSYMLFICMGLYSFTYSGLKQTIAMGFCCLALIQLLDGTFRKFVFLTLVGALFHAPALLFLLTWPISRQKMGMWYFAFLGAMLAIVFIFRDQIANFMESAYYSDERAEEIVATESGVGGRFLMMLFILFGATFFRPPSATDRTFSRLYGVMGLAAVFQMLSVYNNVYTRLADYFFQFVVIFAPMFLQRYEHDELGRRRKRGIFTNSWEMYVLAGLAITVFSLWFYRGQVAAMQKYYFFWEFDAHKWYGA